MPGSPTYQVWFPIPVPRESQLAMAEAIREAGKLHGIEHGPIDFHYNELGEVKIEIKISGYKPKNDVPGTHSLHQDVWDCVQEVLDAKSIKIPLEVRYV